MDIQTKIRLGSAFLVLLLLATGGTALFLLRDDPFSFNAMQAVVVGCGLIGLVFWINFPSLVAPKTETPETFDDQNAPLATLENHFQKLEKIEIGQLSPEQIFLIEQIKQDCQKLLKTT